MTNVMKIQSTPTVLGLLKKHQKTLREKFRVGDESTIRLNNSFGESIRSVFRELFNGGIMFEISSTTGELETREGAKIKVIGVGGGGCNAVNTMIKSGLTGVGM